MKSRRNYDAEFKKTQEYYLKKGKSVSEVASNLA